VLYRPASALFSARLRLRDAYPRTTRAFSPIWTSAALLRAQIHRFSGFSKSRLFHDNHLPPINHPQPWPLTSVHGSQAPLLGCGVIRLRRSWGWSLGFSAFCQDFNQGLQVVKATPLHLPNNQSEELQPHNQARQYMATCLD
jgi:hypothetical protein